MGCAASLLQTKDINSNALTGKVLLNDDEMKNYQKESENVDRLEDFVQACIVTGNQVEAVKKFFQNQSALEAFMKFLKEEHAEENGEFFKVFMAQIEIDRVMKCESNIDNVANSLVEKYIRPGSESEVNVSNQVRDQILVQLRASRKGNTDFEENIKDSFYQAQNEIIIILAMDALPRYLQSDIFKGWREMEVQNGYCAVNLIQEIEARSSMKHLHDSLNSIKLDPTRNHSTAFIQRAFATLDPIEIPRIAKSCYLSTFLGSVEGLPISVSLSSASKDRKGFPLIYVNSVFEEVTGYPRNDIIGRNCRFLQAGKAEADKISALAKALREAKPIKIEITNYRKNGEEFRNLLAMKPIFNYKGEYSFIIGLQFDVSGQSSTVSKLQLIDHLVSMLPDRLPKNDEYSPLYEPYHF